MKRKNILVFILLVIAVVLISCVALILRNDRFRNKENKNTQVINIDLQEFKLENREKIFVNNELLVGENIKELENGYYDFKLANDNDLVVITLNKLWYEVYGSDYIQDEYLAKICREIVRCLNVNEDKEELEYQLYKYIKDSYLAVKEGLDGAVLELDHISICSKSIASECVLYVKVE